MIKTIQKNLGFGALDKIDPNTQQVPGEKQKMGKNALAQAAIPAILLGIFAQLEQDPDWLVQETTTSDSLETIFGSSAEPLVGRIEDYARMSDGHTGQELKHIAIECIRVIRKDIGEYPDAHIVNQFVHQHKPDIIQYLPPELGLGILLNNNNLDDRTGKMNGPVSNLMHQVEKAFNASGKV